MRQAFTVTLLLALVSIGLFGQDTKSAGRILTFIPPDPSSPVPGETLRKIAVQIELLCKVNGTPQPQPFAGTGFLVGFEVPPMEEHLSFSYLVTNRHVAECWDENNNPREVVSTVMRINTKNGGAITRSLNGPNGKPNWLFPDDSSVDLAVESVSLPANLNLDILLLGFNGFAARDSFRQRRIGEGSTVVVTGYFVQFPGDRRFQPIMRQGILSMVPDEPLNTSTGKPGTVYLADIHIYEGNSGSPVFARPQDDITHMGEN